MTLGTPLSELRPLDPSDDKVPRFQETSRSVNVKAKKPASITFVRSRAFHGRPAVNAKGKVTFGLRHIRMLTWAAI